MDWSRCCFSKNLCVVDRERCLALPVLLGPVCRQCCQLLFWTLVFCVLSLSFSWLIWMHVCPFYLLCQELAFGSMAPYSVRDLGVCSAVYHLLSLAYFTFLKAGVQAVFLHLLPSFSFPLFYPSCLVLSNPNNCFCRIPHRFRYAVFSHSSSSKRFLISHSMPLELIFVKVVRSVSVDV